MSIKRLKLATEQESVEMNEGDLLYIKGADVTPDNPTGVLKYIILEMDYNIRPYYQITVKCEVEFGNIGGVNMAGVQNKKYYDFVQYLTDNKINSWYDKDGVLKYQNNKTITSKSKCYHPNFKLVPMITSRIKVCVDCNEDLGYYKV
jgi:hypothetical protein